MSKLQEVKGWTFFGAQCSSSSSKQVLHFYLFLYSFFLHVILCLQICVYVYICCTTPGPKLTLTVTNDINYPNHSLCCLLMVTKKLIFKRLKIVGSCHKGSTVLWTQWLPI